MALSPPVRDREAAFWIGAAESAARKRRGTVTRSARLSSQRSQERAGMENANSARIPPSDGGVTVLWTAPNGVRCVVTRYDGTRYQLRLVRDGGTIKADLFSDHAEAVAASREWRRQIEDVHPLKADLDT
jgi:hypothetical protein